MDLISHLNLRAIRIARLAMSAHARRWRIIRRDPQERARAQAALAAALRLRNLACAWDRKS